MLCQEDYMLLSDCSAPLRKAKCLLVFSFSKDRILFVIMQHLFYFKHEGFVKKKVLMAAGVFAQRRSFILSVIVYKFTF